MTWFIRAMNGAIPVVFGQDANTVPVCTSRAASSARAPLRWYSCSTRIGWPGAGGVARWHRARALDGGLGVDGDNAVTGAQRLALAEALAQIKDHGRPGGE